MSDPSGSVVARQGFPRFIRHFAALTRAFRSYSWARCESTGLLPSAFVYRRPPGAQAKLPEAASFEMVTMTDDKEKEMKSAYEIAMERFRKSDEASGVERRPVTDAQKAAIAEIRNFYQAKIAELEVLHQGRMRMTPDPAERTAREDEYRRDRERLSSERDAKIEKARQG